MNTENPATSSDVSIRVSPASIGCFVLIVSFFLPWINVLGASIAGFELGKISPNLQWLWAIPVTAAVAVLLSISGRKHIEVAQVAGGLPLIVLTVALHENGKDLLSVLNVGAWGSVASGFFLLCVAPRLGKKSTVQTAPAEETKS